MAFPNGVKHKWSESIVFQWDYPALKALPFKCCRSKLTYFSVGSDNNTLDNVGVSAGQNKTSTNKSTIKQNVVRSRSN